MPKQSPLGVPSVGALVSPREVRSNYSPGQVTQGTLMKCGAIGPMATTSLTVTKSRVQKPATCNGGHYLNAALLRRS